MMKPPITPVEKITPLRPLCLRMTIPQSYADANGHMNMRWYGGIFDDAGETPHNLFGLTPEFHKEHRTGTMDLEHHTSFLNEVLPDSSVAVYMRMVAHSQKLIHYLMFMVNEQNGKLAAQFECVNAFVDLRVRKIAPYPSEVLEKIEQLTAEHQRLEWPAPVCGAMRV
jgi:acyl-CoA thioester hydrolase